MTSTVDATLPANNVKASKADFRAQFLVIKDEISALQVRTGLAGAQAFYGFVTIGEVKEEVRRLHDALASVIPRDMAFGRTSLTAL